MFGMNEKVGQNYFKDIDDNKLLVTSMFYTLQGEGPYRGFPAYFIRLAKCNLSCSFCDTYFDQGDQFTFDELMSRAKGDIYDFYLKRDMEIPEWASKFPQRKVVLVITGGEPSLQKNLGRFLEIGNRDFYKSQIESNGILFADLPEETTYVVSPKCSEKGSCAIKYFRPNKKVLDRADCLKFVISGPDLKYTPYSEVPEWAHKWAADTGKEVYVSPMNIYKKEPQKAKELRIEKEDITIEERSTVDEVISFWEPDLLDLEQNRRNHEYAAEYAMKYGFILNLQIHLFSSLP